MTNTELPAGLSFLDGGDAETYAALLAAARETGRCPVWVGPTPWFDATQVPDDVAGQIGVVRAEDVLIRWWPGPCGADCLCLDPFLDGFPPMVRGDGPDRSTAPATFARATEFGQGRAGFASLATVDVARPADIPAALGWTGPCNHGEYGDVVRLGAVLRSWEERFGATLVWIGGATLILAVADPPLTCAESERVAAEHVAFCPDQLDPQTGREPYTPKTYARTIRGTRQWKFWWD